MSIIFFGTLSHHIQKNKHLIYLKNDLKEDMHQTYFLRYFCFLSFFYQDMVLGISFFGYWSKIVHWYYYLNLDYSLRRGVSCNKTSTNR